MRFKRGFIYKFFSYKNLKHSGVVPDYPTVEKFSIPDTVDFDDEPNDSDFLPLKDETEKYEALRKTTISLSKGDKVKVVKGELKGIKGQIIEIRDRAAIIKPHKNLEIDYELNIDISYLVKDFEIGDHIAVVQGKYEGERG